MSPAPRDATGGALRPTSPTKPHLDSIDVVRVLTVGLVIAVHVVSQQPGGIGVVNGATLIVMHVSRQVFFMVTTFVLVYMYRDRPPRWWVFWRRRYLLIGVPYLVWSAVYFLADGHRLWPVGPALLGFAHDVVAGTARYHLYFLLVTMQVYLVFPLLLGLLRLARRRHGRLVAVAVAYELAAYAVIEHGAPLGVLTGWVHNPSPYLPTYLGFVVIGAVAACHTDGLLAWTRARARWIHAGTGLVIAAAVAVLLIHVLVAGQPAWAVSSVFQPVVVIESLAIAWTYLALGLAWQRRGAPRGRPVRVAAEASFGVYLAHPLLLQGLLLLSEDTGLSAVAQRAPGGLVTAVSAIVVAPLIYLICTVFAELVRRTPLSLPLTGRARRRVPQPSPAEPSDEPERSAYPRPAPGATHHADRGHLAETTYGGRVAGKLDNVPNKFALDVTKIRDDARRHMQEGPVTATYGGDTNPVLDILNQVVATEIVCYLRYTQNAIAAVGIDRAQVAAEFREHAAEELQHGLRAAERINQLGGAPDFDPATLAQRAHTEYSTPPAADLDAMLQENLVAERIVISSYQEIIRWIGTSDPTTRRLMEDILEEEEDHANDLTDLLGIQG